MGIQQQQATDDEADEILATGMALFPGLADYGRRASRQLDVFVLTEAGNESRIVRRSLR